MSHILSKNLQLQRCAAVYSFLVLASYLRPAGTRTRRRHLETARSATVGIPPTDTSIAGSLDGRFTPLCKAAATRARRLWQRSGRRSSSPRNVLLFKAGVHVCRGEVAKPGLL